MKIVNNKWKLQKLYVFLKSLQNLIEMCKGTLQLSDCRKYIQKITVRHDAYGKAAWINQNHMMIWIDDQSHRNLQKTIAKYKKQKKDNKMSRTSTIIYEIFAKTNNDWWRGKYDVEWMWLHRKSPNVIRNPYSQ